ncbi:MAG: nucleotide exchange factor GrpE [Candidatus Zixiibacteriota bacterium]
MSEKTHKESKQAEKILRGAGAGTSSGGSQEAPESAAQEQTAEPEDLSETERELALAQDRYLRLAAEFENFKKRSARERSQLMDAANDRLLMMLLDVIDNFERALDQTEQRVTQDGVNKEKLFLSLHEGARMIHDQLKKMLEAQGVAEIPSEGAPFDPELHEAVLQLETGDCPADHVAQVISKGYKKGKRVLRHARVGVAKAREENS